MGDNRYMRRIKRNMVKRGTNARMLILECGHVITVTGTPYRGRMHCRECKMDDLFTQINHTHQETD